MEWDKESGSRGDTYARQVYVQGEESYLKAQFSESNSQKIKSGIPSSSLIGVKVFK